MKTEVYSWRVSTELKTGLEREARRRKISLSAALDLAAQEWLKKNGEDDDAAEQKRLHEAAAKAIGTIKGGDPRSAENVREIVRQRIRERRAR
jgi:hypothetical protein